MSSSGRAARALRARRALLAAVDRWAAEEPYVGAALLAEVAERLRQPLGPELAAEVAGAGMARLDELVGRRAAGRLLRDVLRPIDARAAREAGLVALAAAPRSAGRPRAVDAGAGTAERVTVRLSGQQADRLDGLAGPGEGRSETIRRLIEEAAG